MRWLLIALATVMLAGPVLAMSWYEPQCCSGRDCEPIPFEAVEDTAAGYHVHYLAKSGFAVDIVVPYNKARHSEDGRFHGCASTIRFAFITRATSDDLLLELEMVRWAHCLERHRGRRWYCARPVAGVLSARFALKEPPP